MDLEVVTSKTKNKQTKIWNKWPVLVPISIPKDMLTSGLPQCCKHCYKVFRLASCLGPHLPLNFSSSLASLPPVSDSSIILTLCYALVALSLLSSFSPPPWPSLFCWLCSVYDFLSFPLTFIYNWNLSLNHTSEQPCFHFMYLVLKPGMGHKWTSF